MLVQNIMHSITWDVHSTSKFQASINTKYSRSSIFWQALDFHEYNNNPILLEFLGVMLLIENYLDVHQWYHLFDFAWTFPAILVWKLHARSVSLKLKAKLHSTIWLFQSVAELAKPECFESIAIWSRIFWKTTKALYLNSALIPFLNLSNILQ